MRQEARIHSLNLATFVKGAPGEAPEVAGIGTTLDLSEHGLKVMTREPLAEGDLVHVEIALGPEIIRAEARVQHVEEAPRQYNIGLRFEAIDPEMEAKFRRYLMPREIPTINILP